VRNAGSASGTPDNSDFRRLIAGIINQTQLPSRRGRSHRPSAHLASNCGAENGWKLERRRYSRPQRLGHRPSFACASRRLACDDTLRPAKADLIEVEIRQMRADVVEHTRDGTADAIVEALRRVDVNRHRHINERPTELGSGRTSFLSNVRRARNLGPCFERGSPSRAIVRGGKLMPPQMKEVRNGIMD
jgi:hypothetical protein